MTVKALAFPFDGLERQGKQSECHPPPAKKSRGLLSHYKSGAPSQRGVLAEDNPQQQLIDYIGKLTQPEFEEDMSMSTVCAKFPQLKPLFEYVFCVPKRINHATKPCPHDRRDARNSGLVAVQ